MSVRAIPAGYHTITPYIPAAGAAGLIDFLKNAFEAEEIDRATMPDGTVKNVELKIGDSMLMASEASAHYPPRPATIYLYVEAPEVDRFYKRGIEAGAKSLMEPADLYYGDRCGGLEDAWGNHWWIGARLENLSGEEIARRAQAAHG